MVINSAVVSQNLNYILLPFDFVKWHFTFLPHMHSVAFQSQFFSGSCQSQEQTNQKSIFSQFSKQI